MRTTRRTRSSAAALAMAAFGLSGLAGCSREQAKPPPAQAQNQAQKPAQGQAQPAAAPVKEVVEPQAVDALKRMSAYLGTLTTFGVRADTTRDLVTMDGHRVQIGGVTQFKVRRPNGFQIDVNTDYMHRRFYFDGKQFTVYAPELTYYATAPAPPTNIETLGVLEDRYGISVPLVDLFLWNDPSKARAEALTSGFLVGPAKVDGTPTQHYAFREEGRDWEVWIQDGAQPLPRKLVIVDRTDEARPAYAAKLTWTLKPATNAADFTFHPGRDAKAIHLASLNQ